MDASWAINMLSGAYADLPAFARRRAVHIHQRLAQITSEGLGSLRLWSLAWGSGYPLLLCVLRVARLIFENNAAQLLPVRCLLRIFGRRN